MPCAPPRSPDPLSLCPQVVAVYNLTLQVADMSGDGLTATASAIITLEDINDNAPEFTGDQVPPLPAVARGCPPPILVVGGRGGWVLRGGTLSGLCRTPG